MAQTAIKTRPRQIDFSHILVIGSWGFAIVIASMLALYSGVPARRDASDASDLHAGAVLPGAAALHRQALQGRLG